MGRQYRKFDQDFQQGAVRLVSETGKPIAQVARELGINEGTLGNWCARERRRRENGHAALSEDEPAELLRLRKGDVPPSGGCSPHRVGQRCGDYDAIRAGCATSFVDWVGRLRRAIEPSER